MDLTGILKKFLKEGRYHQPVVIITDSDQSLIDNTGAIISHTYHNLCYAHIHSSINTHHQSDFSSVEVDKGIDWMFLMYLKVWSFLISNIKDEYQLKKCSMILKGTFRESVLEVN